MTRLERHQQKENQKKVLSIGAVIIVVIAVAVYGLPAMINLSSSVGKSLGSNGASEQKSDDPQFSTVDLSDIPNATNSASLKISGSVANIDNLTVYLNGEVSEKINVSGKSDFDTELNGLKSGSNEIYASGTKKGSTNTRESQKFTVTYRAGKPKLDISDPQDNSSTPRDEIVVKGSTDANSDFTVKINGAPTVIGADGNFQGSVKLKDGDNHIIVNVTDSAGNSEEKTVNVKYEK